MVDRRDEISIWPLKQYTKINFSSNHIVITYCIILDKSNAKRENVYLYISLRKLSNWVEKIIMLQLFA